MEEEQQALEEKAARLELENKKLRRELRHISKDNEILRLANEQAVHAQELIQHDNTRQIFYIRQLLKTLPYLLILTDEKLNTVMTSDVYFQFGGCNRARIQSGVQLREALEGILPEEEFSDFLDKCKKALEGEYVGSYIFQGNFFGQRRDMQVNIRSMLQDGYLTGLNIMFVDMTQIVDAKERAEAADLAKSNFLANMSHEIRTPMNTINGMTEFILRDSEDEEAKKHASMIQSASRTLLSIINDILDFSRIESGKMEIVEDAYKLSSLINDVAAMIRVRLQETQTELIVDVGPDVPDNLCGDEVRIKQILINLLGNAVKFTREGSITLRLRYEKVDEATCRLCFSVKDTGIGIREKDQAKLFSSFSQVDTRRNRAIEGSGLGLAISKQLVEMMGGSIRVYSVYGEGTKISFDIINRVIGWEPVGEIGKKTSPAKTEAFHVTFRAPEARILVVDDNEMNLDVAAGLLYPYGCEITSVQSGAEAMVCFVGHDYDIIFIDHMMPVMDGAETMEKLRQMQGGEKVVMIALTANALSTARAEYLAMGFDDFLAKPVVPRVLDEMLRMYLPPEMIIEAGQETAEIKEADGREGGAPEGMGRASSGYEPVMEAGEEKEVSLDVLKNNSEFNVARGLGYCMNDPAFYLTTVSRFVKRARDKELEEQFAEKNWDDYLITVHAVKGNLLTIGAEGASQEAKELEFALKEGRTEYVSQHHEAFMNRYRALIEVCRVASEGKNRK